MKRFKGKISYVNKKDGSLWARGVYRDDYNKPKQVWRKVYNSRTDAKDAVIEEIEKILNKEKQVEQPKTFEDLAEYYKTTHAIPAKFINDVKVEGKKSWRTIQFDITQLQDFFGKIKLTDITRDLIQKYRIKRLDTPVRKIIDEKEAFVQRSFASVNHELRTLRAMMNVALTQNWLERLPNFAGLISASSENARETIPTKAEFARILNAIESKDRIKHILPIVLMIADCGARPIEIWNLKWNDIDLEEKIVFLTSDKGRKRVRRKVGLTDRLIAELEKLKRINDSVFNQQSIKSSWQTVQTDADVKHLTPYHLRHLFNSRLVELGYSDAERLKLMGQTEFTTNLRYTHLTTEVIQKVSEQLNNNPYLPVQESETLQ